MRAPAELPLADEALRALFDRFKASPASDAFGDLSEALLARGHATEALRIAEHGLQLVPSSADGRVHRAAALIALTRPKVAYVELRRALAIEPTHPKALRLLGRVYVEAGLPERAAELLQRRHEGPILPPSPARDREIENPTPTPVLGLPAAPRIPDFRTQPNVPSVVQSLLTLPDSDLGPKIPPPLGADTFDPEGGSPIPELFAALTHDLGLGAIPSDLEGRVEVTQVIRARLKPRRPGDRDQLTSIEGPIVDTTQTRQLEIIQRVAPGRRPSSLYDVVTSPEFHVTIDDEHLFSEAMPFEIRPVPGIDDDAETIDDSETVSEGMPDKLDLEILRRALGDPTPARTEQSPSPRAMDVGDTDTDPDSGALQEAAAAAVHDAHAKETVPEGFTVTKASAAVAEVIASGLATTPAQAPAPAAEPASDLDLPYLKRYKRQASGAQPGHLPPLEVRKPRLQPARVALAAAAFLLMAGFLIGLAWFSREELSLWIATGSTNGVAHVEPSKR